VVFVIEPLADRHDRNSFSCGVVALDRYLQRQARQDVRRRTAVCYVACEEDGVQIAGYYTLSAGDVALDDLPDDVARRLPRYPMVPVARLGRLAVATQAQGKNLGAALLWDAATRALRAELGVFALLVEAKDDPAASFYRHHGFVALSAEPLKLFLPLSTVAALR